MNRGAHRGFPPSRGTRPPRHHSLPYTLNHVITETAHPTPRHLTIGALHHLSLHHPSASSSLCLANGPSTSSYPDASHAPPPRPPQPPPPRPASPRVPHTAPTAHRPSTRVPPPTRAPSPRRTDTRRDAREPGRGRTRTCLPASVRARESPPREIPRGRGRRTSLPRMRPGKRRRRGTRRHRGVPRTPRRRRRRASRAKIDNGTRRRCAPSRRRRSSRPSPTHKARRGTFPRSTPTLRHPRVPVPGTRR